MSVGGPLESPEKQQLTTAPHPSDAPQPSPQQQLSDDRAARKAEDARQNAQGAKFLSEAPSFDSSAPKDHDPKEWNKMHVGAAILPRDAGKAHNQPHVQDGKQAPGHGTEAAAQPGAEAKIASAPPPNSAEHPQPGKPVANTVEGCIYNFSERLYSSIIGKPLEAATQYYVNSLYDKNDKDVQDLQKHGGTAANIMMLSAFKQFMKSDMNPVNAFRPNENVEALQKYIDSRGVAGVAEDWQKFAAQNPNNIASQIFEFVKERGPDGLDPLRPRYTLTEHEKTLATGIKKYFDELPEKLKDPAEQPKVAADAYLAVAALMTLVPRGAGGTGMLADMGLTQGADAAATKSVIADATIGGLERTGVESFFNNRVWGKLQGELQSMEYAPGAVPGPLRTLLASGDGPAVMAKIPDGYQFVNASDKGILFKGSGDEYIRVRPTEEIAGGPSRWAPQGKAPESVGPYTVEHVKFNPGDSLSKIIAGAEHAPAPGASPIPELLASGDGNAALNSVPRDYNYLNSGREAIKFSNGNDVVSVIKTDRISRPADPSIQNLFNQHGPAETFGRYSVWHEPYAPSINIAEAQVKAIAKQLAAAGYEFKPGEGIPANLGRLGGNPNGQIVITDANSVQKISR